jgi:hypothetical protein
MFVYDIMIGSKKTLGKAVMGFKLPLGKARMGMKLPMLDGSIGKQLGEAVEKKIVSGLERRILKR